MGRPDQAATAFEGSLLTALRITRHDPQFALSAPGLLHAQRMSTRVCRNRELCGSRVAMPSRLSSAVSKSAAISHVQAVTPLSFIDRRVPGCPTTGFETCSPRRAILACPSCFSPAAGRFSTSDYCTSLGRGPRSSSSLFMNALLLEDYRIEQLLKQEHVVPALSRRDGEAQTNGRPLAI